MSKEIQPYIFEKSKVNGFDFYRYLHIRGGAGDPSGKKSKHRSGGQYDFIVFYALPEEMEGHNATCERIWCEEMEIPYGEGATIEEAYADWEVKYEQFKHNT